MKKAFQRAALLLLALSMLALTACGGNTVASYQERLDEIMTEINDNNTWSAGIDYTDQEQVDTYISDTKAIFNRLAGLKAPGDLADAQEKIAEGAALINEYLDRIPELLTLQEEGAGNVRDVQMELALLFSDGLALISEGYNLAMPAGGEEDTAG